MKENCGKFVTGKIQKKTLIAKLDQRYVEIKITYVPFSTECNDNWSNENQQNE